jgi:hypothetical protein
MSSGSVWEALREKHAEVAGERDPLYLDDPVHDGVVYRYRYVPAAEMKGVVKRLSKIRDSITQQVASSIETIILSLEEIMVQAPDGEVPTNAAGVELHPQPLKPLADEGEPPITFEERLCRGMEFPDGTEKSARRIVRTMFARNDYLIIDHAQEISGWAASTGENVRDDLSEEIEGGQ